MGVATSQPEAPVSRKHADSAPRASYDSLRKTPPAGHRGLPPIPTVTAGTGVSPAAPDGRLSDCEWGCHAESCASGYVWVRRVDGLTSPALDRVLVACLPPPPPLAPLSSTATAAAAAAGPIAAWLQVCVVSATITVSSSPCVRLPVPASSSISDSTYTTAPAGAASGAAVTSTDTGARKQCVPPPSPVHSSSAVTLVLHLADVVRIHLPRFDADDAEGDVTDVREFPFTFSLDFEPPQGSSPIGKRLIADGSSPFGAEKGARGDTRTSASSSRGASRGADTSARSPSRSRTCRLSVQAQTSVELLAWLHSLRRVFFAHAPPAPVSRRSPTFPTPQLLQLVAARDAFGLLQALSSLGRARACAALAGRDGMGQTPVILAAQLGSARVLKLLLQWGGGAYDVNLNGESPLCCAAAGGHARCIDLIVASIRQRCAALPVATPRGEERLPLCDGDASLCKLPPAHAVAFAVNHSGVGGVTPLHWAASRAHVHVMEGLLALGADPLAADDCGWTVGHYAAGAGAGVGVGPLLGSGAGASSSAHTRGASAGSDAASARPSPGAALAALALVCEQCDDVIDWFDGQGNAPLHVAAVNGWTAGVEMLLQTCANPHAWNTEGQTAIAMSACAGDLPTTLVLEDYEDSCGVADPETVPTPHPARWVHASRARACAAIPSESEKLERVMAVWSSFFERALGGGADSGTSHGATPRELLRRRSLERARATVHTVAPSRTPAGSSAVRANAHAAAHVAAHTHAHPQPHPHHAYPQEYAPTFPDSGMRSGSTHQRVAHGGRAQAGAADGYAGYGGGSTFSAAVPVPPGVVRAPRYVSTPTVAPGASQLEHTYDHAWSPVHYSAFGLPIAPLSLGRAAAAAAAAGSSGSAVGAWHAGSSGYHTGDASDSAAETWSAATLQSSGAGHAYSEDHSGSGYGGSAAGDGWEYGVDDSGYGYYYNAWTGESVWDTSSPDQTYLASRNTATAHVAAGTGEYAYPYAEAWASDAPAHASWQSTNTSTSAAHVPAPEAPAATSVASSEWEHMFDHASGCYYWLNSSTGESQWS